MNNISPNVAPQQDAIAAVQSAVAAMVPPAAPPVLDIAKIERLLEQEIQHAVNHIYGSDFVAAERERNLDYYNSVMADLPAPKGRSRQIVPVVKTYVDMMIPSLMRIFFSGRDYAVFSSSDARINELCKSITRFINDTVFRKDNRGVIVGRGAIKDALLCKVGMLKAWWKDAERHEDDTYDNLNDDQFAVMMAQALGNGLMPVGYSGPFSGEGPLHSVVLRRTTNTSKVDICGIPPEEWLISRDARCLEDAVLRAHRYGAKVGELVARGYDAALVDSLTDYVEPVNSRSNQRGRNTTQDKSLREVTVFEGIILCDPDGEGLREHFFVAGGSASKVKLLEIEPYKAQVIFADLQSDHDPHGFWGLCPADDLAQLQKVETVLVRQMLDNLYLSNTPQREVVADWIINPDQLLNFTPGNPIRVKQPGAIREMNVPFTASNVLQVLSYFEQRAQDVTGASKQAAGLDPHALTGQTATAAQLAYQASMGRLEDIARNLRIGFEKLFRGLFKLVTVYSAPGRVVMLDGKPVPIDPRAWAALGDLDIAINTGLGAGNRDRDANFLFQNLQMQSQFIEKVGPNPAVNFNTLMDSYELWLEALGVENPRQIAGKLPPGWMPTPPPQPPPRPPMPSPDTVLQVRGVVDAEKVKAGAALRRADADRQADIRKFMAKTAADERVALTRINTDARSEAERTGLEWAKLELERARAFPPAGPPGADTPARKPRAARGRKTAEPEAAPEPDVSVVVTNVNVPEPPVTP